MQLEVTEQAGRAPNFIARRQPREVCGLFSCGVISPIPFGYRTQTRYGFPASFGSTSLGRRFKDCRAPFMPCGPC